MGIGIYKHTDLLTLDDPCMTFDLPISCTLDRGSLDQIWWPKGIRNLTSGWPHDLFVTFDLSIVFHSGWVLIIKFGVQMGVPKQSDL